MDILKHVQAHMPFDRLERLYLEMVVREGINPEIGFNADVLDRCQPSDFRDVAQRLLDAGLRVTFHAPFMDLRPGAIDPRIRQVSRDRLQQVFDLVPVFHPRSVVCHPSFDDRYYVTTEGLWLEHSLDTWRQFALQAREMGTVIMLENVYEAEPRHLEALLGALDAPEVRFCFDTGHFNCFSRTDLAEWVQRMGPFLGQLHIHDNGGQADEHLPVGAGTFPFPLFFQMLRDQGLHPLVTIEAHSEPHLRQSLENLAGGGLLAGIL